MSDFDLIPPPMFTTVRVNNLHGDINLIKTKLQQEINKDTNGHKFEIFTHDQLKDVLVISSHHQQVGPKGKEVIVDYLCGMAVLRGANVYIPGILAAPKNLNEDDLVSVYADIKGKCLKGKSEFDGDKLFVGNGKSVVSRDDIFKTKGKNLVGGVGIIMTEVEWSAPSLNNILTNKIFAQNLPSIVVGHVLNPNPGDKVLDMCASPGGKTQHLYALMQKQGHLVAIDRSENKVNLVRQNLTNWFGELGENVELLVSDSRKICGDKKESKIKKFKVNYFDKILLDAPCSALGQRPKVINCVNDITEKQLSSYPILQRQLFATAIHLLKPDGVLVYSTCTTTKEENEGMVEWALNNYPNLTLSKQDPHIGLPGRSSVSKLKQEQLNLLQFFSPTKSDQNFNVNTDTIGFFIAKFVKESKDM